MVRKFLGIITFIFLLSSCAFFGSSTFPTAKSMDIGWFRNMGDISSFYILDNGGGEPLLIMAGVDDGSGIVKVLVFDTALNLRGFMSYDASDGVNPIPTDGVGYISHNDEFIIGQTILSDQGATGIEDISWTPSPFLGDNAAIIPYINSANVDTYIRFGNNGDIDIYDESWNPMGMQNLGISNFKIIPQSDKDLEDIKIGMQSGDVYTLTKKELYEHGMNISLLGAIDPDFTLTDGNFSQWITRCSKGLFVSTDEGDLILYSDKGDEVNRIDNSGYSGNIVTVDWDCEYYYLLVKEEETYIVKERIPF